MALHPLHCGAPDHAAHRDLPGWEDGPMGVVEVPDDVLPEQVAQALAGHLCDACAVAQSVAQRLAAQTAEEARRAQSIADLGFDDGGQLSPEVYAGLAAQYALLKKASS